ncbi:MULTISPECIES: WS/DGAT/MGAT family O-acyltransferase [Mycobacterium avium complex (MAC)]|uniref:Diacylglycerol O-acyltransferase n=1 Tax=Mycobacterium avium subsp. hominissuis TaxID=439334 RepID=A0A2U2E0I7_MYCAV|nr:MULTISPECIES: wax ester/triacylglycerol synthase family O-acyltransferase [Mycobacterium avium complex (MAC)]ETB55964.1 diacylglycerol O-acyltransferase [Mycobacterium avium 10-5560]AXO21435.1 wax ester/triacylglycerol synthase family O-acyltransferase [Mycobacterium avium subsp. hominissuis]ETZ59104.1 acyltransferase, WS/DGAT/MGAT family protein [Mycobacterium sp. MAC_080597_8934]ETZ75473.1 acyltransferase, WS/DGAT/MGAT family protein [Mycobacterium sp. MAC_011194_8550]MCA2238027.1 wax est
MKRLSGWDSVLLYSEAPNVHMHTIKAAVIELDADRRSLDVAAFRQVIAGRLNKLDPFCYQLVEVPFSFHHPMWRENCEIDLDYHIRPWRVSPPGGRRELDEAIGQIASTPLDRSRPLWEMYFVEGLANNRIAVVGKIHHALADGVASANLLARGMDLQPGPEGGPYVCDPPPTTRQLMVSAFADHLRHVGRLPHTIRYTAQGLGRVRRSARKLSPELTRPFEPPPTFMNHKLTPERRFATATLALADVKETGKRLGATINDMVLAMSTGALRTLLLRYDGQAQPLLASVPVSFDFSPERISGNRFTGMLVALPVDHDDPLERVVACHQNAISAKESHQLMGPELVSRWAAYMPPAPTRAFFQWASARDGHNKILNLNISNVPGPRERGRVGGALVTEIYSVGPLTAGSGLNITVWSYVDQLNISVLTDGATCKDPHEVTEAMVQDFIEIRRAAGFSEDLTVIEAAMAPA